MSIKLAALLQNKCVNLNAFQSHLVKQLEHFVIFANNSSSKL